MLNKDWFNPLLSYEDYKKNLHAYLTSKYYHIELGLHLVELALEQNCTS